MLAGTETHSDLGRVVNGMLAAKDFEGHPSSRELVDDDFEVSTF